MKTLISARNVRDWHAQGQTEITVTPGSTIVTPEARSIAAELGVRLVESAADAGSGTGSVAAAASGAANPPALRDAIRKQVKAKLPSGRFSDAELDAIIDKVLNEGEAAASPKAQQQKHYQYQAIGGIKRIDAASVDFGSFADTDDGGVGVADVITSSDGSPMTAGYMTWTQCFFPWDLSHDEINVVLDGELHIRADGQELICRAGDAIFIPKGSRLEIGTPGSTRFLYITHASQAKKR